MVYCDSHNSISYCDLIRWFYCDLMFKHIAHHMLQRDNNKSAENMLAHYLKVRWRTSYRMKNTGVLAQVQPTTIS
jgi:hypothetical protein